MVDDEHDDDEHDDDDGIIVILPSIAQNGMSVFEVNVKEEKNADKTNDDVSILFSFSNFIKSVITQEVEMWSSSVFFPN